MFTTTSTLFDEIFQNGFKEVSRYPLTDISYTTEPNMVFIDIALAGFKKDDIRIKTEGNTLVISSDGITDEDIPEETIVQKHIAKRSFKRVIKLAKEYIDGKINASMENGLLSITIEPSKTESNYIQIS